MDDGPLETHAFILLTFSPLHHLISPQLYSSVDFGRKWQLIHGHVTPNRFYWWVIFFLSFSFFRMRLHSSSPKFCLFRSAEAVVRVPSDWASDIDGSERGVSPASDATGISAHFPTLDTAGQRLISLLGTLFAFSVWQHVTSIPQTRPAHISQINKNY